MHSAVDGSSSEQQFRKLDVSTFNLLCERSGAVLLVPVGLTAGWQAVRQNTGKFELFCNSLPIALLGFSRYLTNVHCYYSVSNAFLFIK